MRSINIFSLLLTFTLLLAGCGGNQAPSVSINSPENNETLRELRVDFTGVAEDPEGKALTYEWDFGDELTGSGSQNSHTYEEGGNYTVKLTVTDEGDAKGSSSINIRVNDPPRVVSEIITEQDAGVVLKFLSGEAPLTVNFDGSKTTDKDGTIFSYVWDFGDGSGTVESASTQHVYELPGEYNISLRVTDNMGAITEDTSINVTVLQPAIPISRDENGTHIIRMVTDDTGNYFEPAIVKIQPGDTVRWINTTGVHATASYSPGNQKAWGMPEGGAEWDSGLMTEADATYEQTFNTEGTYAYYCLPHEGLGMVGLIIVGDVSPELNQDFLNGLGQPAREEFAKLSGLGAGGVIHTIEMTSSTTFSPAVLRVSPGDTIKWVNASAFPHTVTAYHPDNLGKGNGLPTDAVAFDSGLIPGEGDEWTYTIPLDAPPGTYAYFCLPHESLGMVGLLVVEDYVPLSEAFISTLTEQTTQDAFATLMEEALNLP